MSDENTYISKKYKEGLEPYVRMIKAKTENYEVA